MPNSATQRPPSAPLSPSPVALKIKSEPISPPREAMATLQVRLSSEKAPIENFLRTAHELLLFLSTRLIKTEWKLLYLVTKKFKMHII